MQHFARVLEQAGDPLDEHAALLGQRHAPGRPVEDGVSQLALELGDAFRHRGLGDSDMIGGRGERPVASGRDNMSQAAVEHGAISRGNARVRQYGRGVL